VTNDKRNIGPTDDQKKQMYERMLLIRRMEERLSADSAAGNLPGAVHLYIGQEAVAVGTCAHLSDTDQVTSTHRGHGHFLAKGGDPKAMMAEIWGKRTGICQGMGGSMHVTDMSKGMLGANGIVAAGMGIATGAGFSNKLDDNGHVTVCFFGDGAANAGPFMETLNISTLWKLPVVFMCENNTFAELSPAHTVTAGRIIDRARGFGIPCTEVDGNDVTAVWQAVGDAVDHARAGQGPSFIEAHTYRIRGHIESEEIFTAGQKYRPDEEIEEWKQRCPIERFKQHLVSEGVCSEGEIDEIGKRIAATVEEAAQFAQDSEPADPDLPFEVMFVGQRP